MSSDNESNQLGRHIMTFNALVFKKTPMSIAVCDLKLSFLINHPFTRFHLIETLPKPDREKLQNAEYG